MAEYRYTWDSVNKKKVYMGKYSSANPSGSGYYGNNEAGNKRYKQGGGEPTKRYFIGSQSKEYTFSDVEHGTHTFTATSFSEALRQAESMGYTRGDYEKRKKKR